MCKVSYTGNLSGLVFHQCIIIDAWSTPEIIHTSRWFRSLQPRKRACLWRSKEAPTECFVFLVIGSTSLPGTGSAPTMAWTSRPGSQPRRQAGKNQPTWPLSARAKLIRPLKGYGWSFSAENGDKKRRPVVQPGYKLQKVGRYTRKLNHATPGWWVKVGLSRKFSIIIPQYHWSWTI